jgi:hypothetical protein
MGTEPVGDGRQYVSAVFRSDIFVRGDAYFVSFVTAGCKNTAPSAPHKKAKIFRKK